MSKSTGNTLAAGRRSIAPNGDRMVATDDTDSIPKMDFVKELVLARLSRSAKRFRSPPSTTVPENSHDRSVKLHALQIALDSGAYRVDCEALAACLLRAGVLEGDGEV